MRARHYDSLPERRTMIRCALILMTMVERRPRRWREACVRGTPIPRWRRAARSVGGHEGERPE